MRHMPRFRVTGKFRLRTKSQFLLKVRGASTTLTHNGLITCKATAQRRYLGVT